MRIKKISVDNLFGIFNHEIPYIIRLADLDILMATHSPDIIQDHWDLTVELKGIEKSESFFQLSVLPIKFDCRELLFKEVFC